MEASKTHSTFQVGDDIARNNSGKLKLLGGNQVALFIPHTMVTPTSVADAMNDANIKMNTYTVRFYPETISTQGRKRFDSEYIKKKEPLAYAVAESLKVNTSDWMFLEITGEASDAGKRGELPKGTALPGLSRRKRRKGVKVNRRSKFTQPKKKRKR